MDGSPKAGDAYFSGGWHTVLLGTTGASIPDPSYDWGGRSIFALDVTNPVDFSNAAKGVGKVLWEFTDNIGLLDNGWADGDLGITLSQPSLARMQNGKWAAIVGNGYNSKNQKPILYILDISLKPNDSNFIIAKISPCTAKSDLCPGDINGLSTPIAVDVDFDHKVDYVYAGDLQGNLWKFDVNCPNRSTTTGDDTACQPNAASTNWKIANNGNPIFIACSKTNLTCDLVDRQPITGKPQVGSVNPDQANALYNKNKPYKPSMMVYFGTGKYLGLTDMDNSSTQQQTLYALWDGNTGDATTDNTIGGRGKLLQQTILTDTITRTITQTDGTKGSQTLTNLRVTSDGVPCYKTSCTPQHKGWYMDLTTPSGKPSERSVSFPLLLNGNILFTTIIPATDPCVTPSQASSWVMELDAITGSRPATSAFDLFGSGTQGQQPDGKFNTFDKVTVNSSKLEVAPSGILSTVGILKTPAIIPGKGVLNKYLGGSTGDTQMVTNPGLSPGRISWRQLR